MGSGAQGGEGISPDLQDAVTIAALVGESRSTTTVPSPEPVAAGAVSGDPVATGEVAAELGMTATVPGEPVAAGGVSGEPVAAAGVSGEPVAAAAVSGDPVAAGALMAERSTPGSIRAESVAAGEVSARPAGAGASRPAGPLARCTSVSRKFGALTAVRAVNLRVDPGEIVGLLGANGAGKTTLIRLLLGLLATSGGQVTLFGESPSRRTRRRIGYVPQGLGLYDDLTVGENLEFSAAVFGSGGPAELPESLLPYAGTLVGALPRGVERRVAFAQALSHRPDLLVLDEPTSGVDPLGRARLWDTVRTAADGGAGVLVTTHYMEEAQECDRLVIMTDGAVVAEGTARQIVGAARVTVVEAVSWATAFRRLEESGLAVALAGRTLRVPGSQRETVLRALRDADARVYAAPATLEERFFELTLPRSATSASA
jgi:ABC-type multidrug transport system ATPase subunit